MKLTAVITPDELSDGSPMFVALCPELDVVSQGETKELAKANLKEALELFFENADPREVERRLRENAGMISELDIAA